MKETLIEFETAKIAKEKGFSKTKRGIDTSLSNYVYNFKGDIIRELSSHTTWNGKVVAPTQSLLQKWLREEHKIFVNPIPNFKTKVGQHHLGIVYMRSKNEVHSELLKNDDLYKSKKLFDTYEQALEQGLINALKLIK